MWWRRWVFGIYPLLVWAEDAEAADLVARVHMIGILEQRSSV